MAEEVLITPPDEDGVGVVEIRRGPENYLTVFVLRALLDALQAFDAAPECGAMVVRTEGKHFCAGRDWRVTRDPADTAEAIYATAPKFLELSKPWVAELTGGSIGVGMGLALCADYRIAADSAYLWPRFVSLGIHHGFGTSVTLPWTVGPQAATRLLSQGKRISAPDAVALGLVDEVAPLETLPRAARAFAAQLASQPRAALAAIKETMRGPLRSEFVEATVKERAAQAALYQDADFQQLTGGGYRYESTTSQ